MPQLYAGTSGFAYATWKPGFYPAKLSSAKFLEHYAQRLNSSEINYTFRRLPTGGTLEKWVAQTPPTFVFSLKAHMRLTHILRLKNTDEFLEVFLRAVDPLRTSGRLGPILFQLPPQYKADCAVLDAFLRLLPKDLRFAFEFRHDSWLTSETYDCLGKYGVALCLAESDKLVVPEVVTAKFIYSRLRKPDYTAEERKEIGDRVERLLADGHDSFVYFKHEDTPDGALYAEELLKRIRPDGELQ
jgi:uncharacterized protein YecE (DUF72 family)